MKKLQALQKKVPSATILLEKEMKTIRGGSGGGGGSGVIITPGPCHIECPNGDSFLGHSCGDFLNVCRFHTGNPGSGGTCTGPINPCWIN